MRKLWVITLLASLPLMASAKDKNPRRSIGELMALCQEIVNLFTESQSLAKQIDVIKVQLENTMVDVQPEPVHQEIEDPRPVELDRPPRGGDREPFRQSHKGNPQKNKYEE